MVSATRAWNETPAHPHASIRFSRPGSRGRCLDRPKRDALTGCWDVLKGVPDNELLNPDRSSQRLHERVAVVVKSTHPGQGQVLGLARGAGREVADRIEFGTIGVLGMRVRVHVV